MKNNQKLKKLAVAAALYLASASVFATNGYFPHGVGVKAKGMGGAAIATTQPTTPQQQPSWEIDGI